ncbi:MAG TPA: flagellar basal body rod C-terminal domain-containing protein, partial [Thauera sp.]|nr:flagellar basal body rod C-terminal domain-containing protein [Thauera sp.]
AASDLLDQRGQAIAELNTLVKVNAVPQRDGSLSIFIGSGQALVLGANAKQLSMGDTVDEKGRPMMLISGTNGTQTPLAESVITGGELGGLLAVRRDGMEPAQRSLGLIAATIATAFNEQHRLGIDLGGALGDDFFSIGGARVEPAASEITVKIDPASLAELTGADYELRKDGDIYTLFDIATGKGEELSVDAEGNAKFAGLSFGGLNNLAEGEPVFVYPTRYAAGTIGMKISDPRQVAAAAPVLASVAEASKGSLQIQSLLFTDSGSLVAGEKVDLSTATLTFADGNVFTLAGGWTSADLTYNPAESAATGKELLLTGPDGVKVTLKISGTPAVGAVITLADNEGGIADNRNAALLGALQTDKLMFGAGGSADRPTATLNNAYAQLVAKVGSKTREVQAGERTQGSLLAQATSARDSVSGVNLDEEAANLVRFQQTYQAAGRVMSVAQRLFDEMLAIGR